MSLTTGPVAPDLAISIITALSCAFWFSLALAVVGLLTWFDC